MRDSECFQDAMPGEVCFGCGAENSQGLRIRSYWEGEIGVCRYRPASHHQGWPGLTCGGIIATLIDCHCMATAMAQAIRNEGRQLNSESRYRFATGHLDIRYLKPTPLERTIELRARVAGIADARKFTVHCEVYCDGEQTATANVIAVLVYRSDRPTAAGSFQRRAE